MKTLVIAEKETLLILQKIKSVRTVAILFAIGSVFFIMMSLVSIGKFSEFGQFQLSLLTCTPMGAAWYNWQQWKALQQFQKLPNATTLQNVLKTENKTWRFWFAVWLIWLPLLGWQFGQIILYNFIIVI